MTEYSENRIHIGCNLSIRIRFRLGNPTRPVVVMSSGYGPSSFDKPLPLALIDVFSQQGLNWVQYVYPERDPLNPINDLLLSGAIASLRAVLWWLRSTGYSSVALYGNSFGANISMETALLEPIEFVVLSNPVLDFVEYRERQLGSQKFQEWETNGFVTIDYERGPARASFRFIEEARHQDFVQRCSTVHCPVIAFQGEQDNILSPKECIRFANGLPNGRVILLPQGEHTIRDANSLELVKVELHAFLAQFPEVN